MMEAFDRVAHWENIYQNKAFTEVSWYQKIPQTSLDFFDEFHIPLDAKIIDVGGGDSYLVDFLLQKGYQNITVLDVSEKAIQRAKDRLKEKASLVQWIVSDVTKFQPNELYDVWHDRAVFHFLTTDEDIESYRILTSKTISLNGYFFLGTFSENGPLKCSGIPIRQYSIAQMKDVFKLDFTCLKSFTQDHHTPMNTIQNFTHCCFQRK